MIFFFDDERLLTGDKRKNTLSMATVMISTMTKDPQ